MKPPEKDPLEPATGKRKYAKPVVRTYGTIRALTRNVANKALNSDGGGKKAKTG